MLKDRRTIRRAGLGMTFGFLLVASLAQAVDKYTEVSKRLTAVERAAFVKLDGHDTEFSLQDFAPHLVSEFTNLKYHGHRTYGVTPTKAGDPIKVNSGLVNTTTPAAPVVNTAPVDLTVQNKDLPGPREGKSYEEMYASPKGGAQGVAAQDSTVVKSAAQAVIQNAPATTQAATESNAQKSAQAAVTAAVAKVPQKFHKRGFPFFSASRTAKNVKDIDDCVKRLNEKARPKLSEANQKQLDYNTKFLLEQRTEVATFRPGRSARGADYCELYEIEVNKALSTVK